MEAAADADGKGVFGWLRSLVRGTKRLPADTSVDQAPDYDGCNSQEILSPSPSGEEPAQATPRPPEPSQPAAKHVVTIDEDKSVEAPPLDATEIDHQAAMPTVVYHSSLDERTVQLLHVLCGRG
jgi:hypothetical protein